MTRRASPAALPTSRCTECHSWASVDLKPEAPSARGRRAAIITYADEDIVVWECPGCRHTNALETSDLG